MSYLINEGSLAELTQVNETERGRGWIKSWVQPIPKSSFFHNSYIPNQRRVPVKLSQWARRNTDDKAAWSVLWWPAGSVQEMLMKHSSHEPFCWLFLSPQKHRDSAEGLGAKKPLSHEQIQTAAWVIVSFQQRIFFLPDLRANLTISEISVHREVINCGMGKGQCLPIGIMVITV